MAKSDEPGGPDAPEGVRRLSRCRSRRLCSLGLMIMLASPAFASPDQKAANGTTGSTPDPALLEFLGTFQTADGKPVDPATFEDGDDSTTGNSTTSNSTSNSNSSDQKAEVKHDDQQ